MGDGWDPGSVVGKYTMVKKLAEGGMAEVWLARQAGPQGFEKLVAVKRVLARVEDDPTVVHLFLDEARIAAQLNHPNVVQIFELGEAVDGTFYLAMEYLAGETVARVARHARQAGGLPTPMLVRILSCAAEGLGYAHQRRGLDGKPLAIVHRDVSPQNVIVTYDGQVKVLDFGIARATTRMSKTSTGVIRGKLAYMAPEQAYALPVDARADVFSLGVMLWEGLTGRRLWGERDDVAVLRALGEGTALPRASSVNPAVPRALDDLCARALSREPAQRPADGLAVHLELDTWRRTQPSPPGPRELGAVMDRLFGERIKVVGQMLEAAMREKTVPATDGPFEITTPTSMPGGTPSSMLLRAAGLQRRRVPLAATAAAIALAVLGGLALVFRAPAAGTLVVETTPRSATVVLDGSPRGLTPFTLTPVPAGKHQLVLQLAGYADAVRMLEVGDGTSTLVDLALERVPTLTPDAGAGAGPITTAPTTRAPPDAGRQAARSGRLSLDTTPWTKVYLGKRLLGDTPLLEVPVPAGTLNLRLVNEAEHVDRVVEIDVKAGAVTTRSLSL